MPQETVDFAPQQWLLKRNCSMSPLQLAAVFVALGVVSMGIALVFLMFGAWPVLLFSIVEVLGLTIAFLVYGRHAGDYERIVVDASQVTVETVSANRVLRRQLAPGWLRIEYGERQRGLIRLVQGRESLAVGRYVAEDQRGELARELRLTLAKANRARVV